MSWYHPEVLSSWERAAAEQAAGRLPPGARTLDARAWLERSNEMQRRRSLGRHRKRGPDDAGIHDFQLAVSNAVSCQYMNITFDPSRGTGPYDVIVAFSNYYAYQWSIPQDYAPVDKGLWTVPLLVPDFPANATSDVIVSLTDSNNVMSNSSRWQTVSPKTTLSNRNCYPPTGTLDFVFYSVGYLQPCGPWTVVWNKTTSTSPGITPPLTLYFLPENQPPLAVPLNATQEMVNAGSGNMTITVPLAAGTTFYYTINDNGINVSGGVSQRNIVGLDESSPDQSCLDNAYQAPGVNDRVPRPTSTVAVAGTAGLAYSYVTQSTLTDFYSTPSVSTATFVATQTVVAGTPLPGWNLTRINSTQIVTPSSGTSKLTIGVATGVGLLAGMLIVAGIGWFCYRRKDKQKRRSGHITKWDAPNTGRVDPTMPVHHGLYTGAAQYQRTGTFDTIPSRTGSSEAETRAARGAADGFNGGPFGDEYGVYHSQSTELNDLTASSRARSQRHQPLASADLADEIGNGGSWAPYAGRTTASSATDSSGIAGWYQSVESKPGQRAGPGATHRSPYTHASSQPSSPANGVMVRDNPSSAQFPLLGPSASRENTRPRSRQGSSSSGGGGATVLTRSGNGGSSGGGTMNARFVQHADAGRLMDDSLEPEVIDLPPQYDTISVAPRGGGGAEDMRAAAQAYAAERLGVPSRSGTAHSGLVEALEAGGTIDSEMSYARGRPLLDRLAGDGDESDFWTSAPEHARPGGGQR